MGPTSSEVRQLQRRIGLHCFPLGRSTGWKGDPVATSARPSVHARASSDQVSFMLTIGARELTRINLTQSGRVGHGEDNRPLDMRCHLPDNLLVKCPRVCTCSNQDGRLDGLNHCIISDYPISGLSDIPSLSLKAFCSGFARSQ